MKKIIFLIKFSSFIFFTSSSLISSSLDVNEILFKNLKSYFLNLTTLQADFIQIGPRGNISKGKLFIDLPGKIRFDYKSPNNLLITSQGFWLYVQDRNLRQTNNIPVSETPLNFLLKRNIKFNDKSLDINVKKEAGLILLRIRDLEKYNEVKLTFQFTETPLKLRKWTIEDEFNNQTSVLLQNVKLGDKISHLLFFPEEFENEGQ